MARMTIRAFLRLDPKTNLTKSHPKWHLPRIACLHIDMSQTKSIAVDQHYTVAEVAELLNVHEMTVRQWYWTYARFMDDWVILALTRWSLRPC